MKTTLPSIAVVGLACHYPDARTPGELWENVLAQRRAFRRIPAERLRLQDYYVTDRNGPDGTYCTEAAVIEGFEFDRADFGIAGNTFRSADLAHWLALDVAARALADAGFTKGEGLPRETTGVLLGNTLTGEFSRANALRLRWPFVRRVVEAALANEDWSVERRREFLSELERGYKSPFPIVGEEWLAGGLSNTIAGRISSQFDLKGAGYTVDGACASSLLALSNACSALVAKDLDVALAGGVDLSLDPFELIGFAKIGVLARELMRVYDARPTGFWPGEGCGFAVLMRHEDAIARGCRIYALVRGWGISSDGVGNIMRPEADGHIQAMRRAYERAGYEINTVEYFEGHGTGTDVGDSTELKAISHQRRGATRPAVIGSIKAIIGHTKAAAGIAGFIKATLAVHNRILPPTTGCENPHSEFTCNTPVLRVLSEPEEWPTDCAARAAVSAMGFGGLNVHLTIEGTTTEPVKISSSPRQLSTVAQDCELFLFAADDSVELADQVGRILPFAAKLSYAELTDLSAELARRLVNYNSPESPRKFRAAIVASSPAEFDHRLATLRGWIHDQVGTRLDSLSEIYLSSGTSRPQLGFIFPGQGSPVYLDGGIFRRRFAPVRKLYPEATLAAVQNAISTEVAQPAIATASLAGIGVLSALGLVANIAVGHSLGEIVAIHWAGAFDEAALLRIVTARGQAMAKYGQASGAMAAISASADQVAELLTDATLSIVAFNSPRQTVIAGESSAVTDVLTRAQAKGWRAIRLPVSHAFHTPLVADSVPLLAKKLATEKMSPLQRQVISTVTGAALPAGEDIVALLCRQITSPVKFVDALAQAANGADLWIEVGPGDVLTRLAVDFVSTPVFALDVGGKSLRGLWCTVGAAFALGAPVNVGQLFADRMTRPFQLDWKPKFFVNPCELAPTTDSDDYRREVALAEEPPPAIHHFPVSKISPLDTLRQLVAERVELPVTSITTATRLLEDLHLNSISVGQLMGEAARRLGLPQIVGLIDFATTTIGSAATVLEKLAFGQGQPGNQTTTVPAGLDSWVRPFVFEWMPSKLPVGSSRPAVGDWEIFAEKDHPIVLPLREMLAHTGGSGVVVIVSGTFDGAAIRRLLASAKSALAAGKGKFLIVQWRCRVGSFARTLQLEAPGIHAHVVEVPLDHPDAVRWIAAEAAAEPIRGDVRYDECGHRYEFVMKPLPLPETANSLPLSGTDVLLISGGGKGITAECALEIGRRSKVRLGLLGRSLPDHDAELKNNLARFAAARIQFQYLATDVSDPEAVRQAVRVIESQYGAITAILHGAGINIPQPIKTLDEDSFQRTLASKLQGARNLLSAVKPDQLRLFLTFGSIIGRAGFPGEADYAVANEQLTQLTEEFQVLNPRCRCLAVEWSVWSSVGMGARLERIESLRQAGVFPITPESGVDMLCRLLNAERLPSSVIVTGRFGNLATLPINRHDLPSYRFLESPQVFYPGVELVIDSTLSSDSDPYVEEHVLDGDRLFPAVMGLEAMAQAAAAVTGIKSPPCFENVEWIRPIVVPAKEKTTIRVAALVREPGLVEVAVRAEDTLFQTDHFRGWCRFADATELLANVPPQVNGDVLAEAPLSLDLERDLYGRLLFHSGRFRRVRDYRILRAKECVCRLEPHTGTAWFGHGLPQDRLLGCPGIRDAAIHAIQACIPHARLLPTGVRRVIIDTALCARQNRKGPSSESELFLAAREIAQEGDVYHFDLELRSSAGELFEKWEDLRLREVGEIPRNEPWNAVLLGPYLERRIGELIPGINVAVACAHGASSEQLICRALGYPVPVFRRSDGKPEINDRQSVSTAHTGELTFAMSHPGFAGCDMERVAARSPVAWRDLLGVERFQLAELLHREEDFDIAATRIWSALECLKKSGVPVETALVFSQRHAGGVVTLKAGERVVTTFLEQVQSVSGLVVIAVITKAMSNNSASLSHGGAPDLMRRKRVFQYYLNISFEDSNVVGNVYFSNYLRWQGKVREQFLAENVPGILAELRSGLELVTLAAECRYFAELFPFDHVRIDMTLETIASGSARIAFDYFRMQDGAEQLVAKGSQEIGACKVIGGERRSVPLPKQMAAALQEYL